eukprot:3350197-Pyramimonas_sp.AAC.1
MTSVSGTMRAGRSKWKNCEPSSNGRSLPHIKKATLSPPASSENVNAVSTKSCMSGPAAWAYLAAARTAAS